MKFLTYDSAYFYILKNYNIMYLKVACRQNIIIHHLRLA